MHNNTRQVLYHTDGGDTRNYRRRRYRGVSYLDHGRSETATAIIPSAAVTLVRGFRNDKRFRIEKGVAGPYLLEKAINTRRQ